MSTIDGLLGGFIVGAALTGGAWAVVERDSAMTPWTPPPRHVVPHLPRSKPPPARPPEVTRQRVSRTRPVIIETTPFETRLDPRIPPLDETPLGTVGDSSPDQTLPRSTHETRNDLQLTVTAGGGVETSLSPAFGNAAQWGLRLGLDPYEHLGFEIAYLKTHGATLDSSTVEVTSRWYPQRPQATRPYLLGGVGWRRFRSPVVDAATFPIGAGVTHVRGRWRVDARLTFRPTSRRTLPTVGATGNVGMTF